MPTALLRCAAVLLLSLILGGLGATSRAAEAPELPQLGGQAAEGTEPKLLFSVDGLPDWATSVAISPDGKTLAVGSYETVRLWNIADAQEQSAFQPKSGFARSLAFSADGRTLAVGSYGAVELWDVEKAERIAELDGQRGYANDLAFSPDGTLLASGGEDAALHVWTLSDQAEAATYQGHQYPVLGLAFSPDGKQIASAAGDETRLSKPGEVKLWEIDSRTEVRTFTPHEKGATDVAFSPDGARLISSSLDERVHVYDLATGEPLGFFGGHTRPVNSIVFAAGGRMAISGSGGRFKDKNEIKFWNPIDGEEWGTVEMHEGKITQIAFSAAGRTLASASYDKTVAVWDITPVLEKAGLQKASPADSPISQAIANVVGRAAPADEAAAEPKVIRVGIIGLDTSHAVAFTKALNAENPSEALAGCRIVAAYPHGSKSIESSVSRIPGYTEEVKKHGVEIVDSIDALLERVDAVLLETNDGRPHLEQVLPVLQAGKPVFVDKPLAASLTDAVAIFEAARHYKTPLFSSSSLRFMEGAQEVRDGKIGDVTGCDAYSPCSLEPTHPELFWYGIHGVEILFTVMKTGCERVSRASTPDFDVVVGVWDDGRIGTFRGIRKGGSGYGGTAFGMKGVTPLSNYKGYHPLVESIVHFYRTGEAPVTEEETLEIYAFMEAADESKRQGGAPVTLESVMERARTEAQAKLKLDDAGERGTTVPQ